MDSKDDALKVINKCIGTRHAFHRSSIWIPNMSWPTKNIRVFAHDLQPLFAVYELET